MKGWSSPLCSVEAAAVDAAAGGMRSASIRSWAIARLGAEGSSAVSSKKRW